jgi:poly-gamma-glutamate capsule biosynthesis protein CapA/YwtB (metallophosphatase superfamily)
MPVRRAVAALATRAALLLVSCTAPEPDAAPPPEAWTALSSFEASEAAFVAAYAATPIALHGRVLDDDGVPLAGAAISLAIANLARTTTSDAEGRFELAGLERHASLLRVQAAGAYDELLPADLQRPLADGAVDLGDVRLTARRPGRARLIFGGDAMFGRRFVEDGLIRDGSRRADAGALLAFLADTLAAADYTVVNLESTVTDDPATPHPTKSFVFHSHPETIFALPDVGVDAVGLGNNHVYDYLEAGIADTLANVAATGIPGFGAGTSETDARATRVDVHVGGDVALALQGFDHIVTDGSSQARYRLTAHDAPGEKGGALELRDANLADYFASAPAGALAIPVLHAGVEYARAPNAALRARFVGLAQAGAAIVVASHPHTTQGVGVVDTDGGPVFALLSLGNLIFDQDVFETFQGYLAVVDVEDGRVCRVQLVPFHAEGYVPSLLAGDAVVRAARRIAHLSSLLPGDDGLRGALVLARGGRIEAFAGEVASEDHEESVALAANAPFEIVRKDGDADDGLADVLAPAGVRCFVGRELLRYGGFEDEDVDADVGEAARWDQTSSHHVEASVVHRGGGAAVLLRSSANSSSSLMPFTNRVAIDPARAHSLIGFVRGAGAGTFTVELAAFDDDGTRLATPVVWKRAPGSYDWQRFAVDVDALLPAGTASLRPQLRATPPGSGEAATFVDDLALVEWSEAATQLPAPDEWSFVRCDAATTVTLVHRRFVP